MKLEHPCLTVIAIICMGLLVASCVSVPVPVTEIADSDPVRGRELMSRYGCAACHRIPVVPGADNHVGAPLDEFARRGYIAGNLVNTPENLMTWLRDPQSIEPGTAMPNMGVTEADARDMAAYLFSLD